MSKDKIGIHWFRQDLRINDNPSLNYLSKKYKKILAVFILDEINSNRKLGSASKIWLYHSLKDLNENISNKLILFKGDPITFFELLFSRFDVQEVSWNRCYEPWQIKRDTFLKKKLLKKVKVSSFNSSLLWEPWEVLKNDGNPYKVFTPFFKRGCLNANPPKKPKTFKVNFFDHGFKSLNLDELELINKKKWETNIVKLWKIGEKGALEEMNNFFQRGINDYADGRNFPIKKNVSRLSPFIHWGQISPNLLWYNFELIKEKIKKNNIEIFKSELGWREFFYNLMYHFPKIQEKNLQIKFDKFPWEFNESFFKAWKKGLTGYPIVDAGMRELWNTGYMHNRARMITGSFLVKNLLIHWNYGEKWFWDCLFDADYANNSASWQWVAGTGTDAAPYFRIFNPITQGKKFDPKGEYIKKYIPELQNVPLKYLFTPWECPLEIGKKIKFIPGKNYPLPIVDVKISREKALYAFSKIKN